MNPGMTENIFLKHCTGNEETLVKIVKSCHNRVASLYVSMRNFIIMITLPKKYWKLELPQKICKNGRYLGQTKNREVETLASLERLEEMEHIC